MDFEKRLHQGESIISDMSSRISETVSGATENIKQALGMTKEGSSTEKLKEFVSDASEKTKEKLSGISEEAPEHNEQLKEKLEQAKQEGRENISGIKEEAQKGHE